MRLVPARSRSPMLDAPADANIFEVLPSYRKIALVLRIVRVYLCSLVVSFVY
jgi:hypothetical protein